MRLRIVDRCEGGSTGGGASAEITVLVLNPRIKYSGKILGSASSRILASAFKQADKIRFILICLLDHKHHVQISHSTQTPPILNHECSSIITVTCSLRLLPHSLINIAAIYKIEFPHSFISSSADLQPVPSL